MGRGWHRQSIRHSNAKRLGKAGPMYKGRRRKLRIPGKTIRFKKMSFVKDVKPGSEIELKRIHRKKLGYFRSPHEREDIGKRGRSKRPKGVPKLKKGRLTKAIRRAGIDKRATELTAKEWARVFRSNPGILGSSFLGMLGTQVARRKYARKGPRAKQKKKFQMAINVLRKERDITPRAAIRKWSVTMTPRERALAMPGGRI